MYFFGLIENAFQQLEHLLAAPCFAVILAEQALLAPGGTAAPGRRQHRLVEKRTEHVASGRDLAGRGPGLGRAFLEARDLVGDPSAQRVDVGKLHRVAQLRGQHQQRLGADQQDVVAALPAGAAEACRSCRFPLRFGIRRERAPRARAARRRSDRRRTADRCAAWPRPRRRRQDPSGWCARAGSPWSGPAHPAEELSDRRRSCLSSPRLPCDPHPGSRCRPPGGLASSP